MSKLFEFYKQAMGEEETKKKIEKILAGKEISDATDEQLEKVGEFAKGLGYEFTLEEVKGYLKGEEVALDEDDLDAVAGGKGGNGNNGDRYSCSMGIGGIIPEESMWNMR